MRYTDNIISSFLLVLLLVFGFVPGTLQSQETTHRAFPYGVSCDVPHTVRADSRFAVTFNIRKEIGYVGPLTVIQELPRGFTIATDTIPYAKITFDKGKYKIFWKNMPLGETFSFEVVFAVENISRAVYPFSGSAIFYHFTIPYSAFVKITSNNTHINAPTQEGRLAPLAIYFETPAKIGSGKEFTFVTIINKESDYTHSGKIIQKWPSVFVPKPTNLKNARFAINDDNSVEIAWKRLDNGNYFSIAYQVFVKENAQGAYAVITDYTDSKGVKLNENKGIYIVNEKKETPKPAPLTTNESSPIRFEYPSEVLQGKTLDFRISIQKGKTTQSGSLSVMFPSGCDIEVADELNATYDVQNGQLTIRWEHLPANPVVEVHTLVNTENVVKAGYMIKASFFINEKLKSSGACHLFITDSEKLAELHENKKTQAADETAVKTDGMLSRIDDLLAQWSDSLAGSQKPVKADLSENRINYRVQIFASRKVLPDVRRLLVSMGIRIPLNVYFDGDYYKYTLGTFISRTKANEYLKFVKDSGFADAFVVEYNGDEPSGDN